MSIVRVTLNAFKDQLPSMKKLVFFIYGPVALLLLVVAAVALTQNIPIGVFMSDTTSWAQLPFYTGLVSNVGILIFAFGAASLFLGYGVLKTVGGPKQRAALFLSSALFTTLLMLDDFFLIHEDMLKRGLGIPEPIVFGIYGAIALAYFMFFVRNMKDSDYMIFLLALVMLGISVGLDLVELQLRELIEDLPVKFFEEGFKLAGIATWSYYFWSLVKRTLVEELK